MKLSSAKRLLSGVAALALSAGIGGAALAEEADTLVIARSMDITSLDPARTFCDTCQIVISAMYDRLVDLGQDNKTVVPLLAKSWTANENNSAFTFNLDPAAVFADGSPVEAKDVKWSLERLANLKDNPSFFMDGMKSVEAPDAHTVVITLAGPDSEFLNKLTGYPTGIINSDVAIQNGADASAEAATKDSADPWFLGHSVGAGPFELTGYKPDAEIRLKRNEKYWRAKPYFSNVVVTQSADSVSQAQLLASGGADIGMQVDTTTAKSAASPNVVYETVPSYNFLYVAFIPGKDDQVPQLSAKIREAMTYAIDYDGMIDFTVAGDGDRISVPIPNGFPGTAGLPMRVQDLKKAKAMLADAGVPNGFSIEAVYPNLVVYGVDVNLMMQKVQQDLARVGIKVALSPTTFPVWREKLNGDPGVAMSAVYYAPDYYGSSQYAQYFAMMEGSPWANRSGVGGKPYINPKEAPLFAKAQASSGAEQEKAFHELALQMYEDNIIIPLVAPKLVLAYRKDIKGVRYSACCNLPLSEISREK